MTDVTKNVAGVTKNVTRETKNMTDVAILSKSVSLSCKWPSCDFSSESLPLLQKHYEQNHIIEDFRNSVIKAGSNNPMFQNLSVRKTIFCQECKKYTENTNHTCQKYVAVPIQRNNHRYHGPPDIKCSICKEIDFASPKELLRHICKLHQPTVKLQKRLKWSYKLPNASEKVKKCDIQIHRFIYN